MGEGPPGTGRSALSVGAGILLSRITGFLRDLTIASFFGAGLAVDAYVAALRVPNILRTLLGEGTLSASFVPVYSELLEREGEEAGTPRRLARGVLGIVLVVAGLLSALGVLLAPLLARAIAPGFGPEHSELTTRLVRILFPMAGVMIVAAWCLGVLNSHRRFFLPFVAPAAWNLTQVAGLLVGARMGWEPLIVALAWSTLLGSVLQLAVQLPTARRLAGTLRPAVERAWEPVRRVARNAAPVAAGQGIFQVSSFLDVVLASTLVARGGEGAVAGMYFAQRLAMLPQSLFGVSVATASLPEMSRGGDAGALRPHLSRGFLRILFFVLPSAAVLLLFGDLVVSVVYERNDFGPGDTRLVRWILGAYALGLVATSLVKLFASGFHALQDTRTPLRFAAVAVTLGIATGAGAMLLLAGRGWGARAATGLALGGALGAWVNLTLLWRGIAARSGPLIRPEERTRLARIVLATLAAVAVGLPVRAWLDGWIGTAGTWRTLLVLLGTLAAAGVPYLAIARMPPRREPRADATPETRTPDAR